VSALYLRWCDEDDDGTRDRHDDTMVCAGVCASTRYWRFRFVFTVVPTSGDGELQPSSRWRPTELTLNFDSSGVSLMTVGTHVHDEKGPATTKQAEQRIEHSATKMV
jgi:hypothetical protein